MTPNYSYELSGFKVFEFSELDSTNSYLKREAEKLPHLSVALARSQTGGRGRLGRSFFSPQSGLYFSALFKSELSLSTIQLLTPMAAVAVAEALEACGSLPAGIKWVNDVYIHEKKVCGILVETGFSQNSSALDWAIIGIGLNLTPPKEGFPDDIKNRAAAAFDSCTEELRKKVLTTVLKLLKTGIEDLGSKAFLENYRRRSILTGRMVDVIHGNYSEQARVIGIDDECRLIVETDNGRQTLNTGEVSIRI